MRKTSKRSLLRQKIIKKKIDINATGISRKYDNDNIFRSVRFFPHGPPIFEALKLQKIEYFDLFLKNKADVGLLDSNGNSILHFFIKHCSKKYPIKLFDEIFKTLLDYKIDHNSRDEEGFDVLNLMAQYSLDELFPAFFKKIKNINVNSFNNNGDNILMHSITLGNDLSQSTKLLIRKKANLDFFNLDGTNALMWSVNFENPSTLKFLMESGANTLSVDKKGNNLMHFLVKIDRFHYDNSYNKFYRIILKNNLELLVQKNNEGNSPLDIIKSSGMYYGEKRKLIYGFVKKIRVEKKKKQKASQKNKSRGMSRY